MQSLRFAIDVHGIASIELVPSYLILGEASIGQHELLLHFGSDGLVVLWLWFACLLGCMCVHMCGVGKGEGGSKAGQLVA